MSWYVAKVVFKISTPSARKVAQFDEHLRLIRADSFEQAFLKARLIGITEEDEFYNYRDEAVTWEFVNISELIPLEELPARLTWLSSCQVEIWPSGGCDGLEVYSQIHETVEARSYITLVHQKAAALSGV